MEILKIEILNPKAKAILKSLADLKLISIKRERKKSEMKALLSKIRQYPDLVPSADDIAGEVEAVRKTRYGK
jgi:hypothetical protein